jgi:hypothetical protein
MRVHILLLGAAVALATAAPVVASDAKPPVRVAMKHSVQPNVAVKMTDNVFNPR